MSALAKYESQRRKEHVGPPPETVCPCCLQALPVDDTLRVDLATNTLIFAGKAHRMRGRAAEILHVLAEAYPMAVTYPTLKDRVFGVASVVANEQNNLDVNLSHIRRALKDLNLPFAVKTIWGRALKLERTDGY
jgi:DNA-binding winged helix-turn-helix (wHTH) protein